ncbi:MAG: MerR family transcriptional regulator [Myxococcales bacterium]|nr:MerR family transcriptional regulator [Myxococcales bacterium]
MARSRARLAPPTQPGREGRATFSSSSAAPRATRAPATRAAPPPALVRISDLARQAGVPAATIKHYMREGLLPRPSARTSRNMAYYDPRLAERVRAIKDLQTRRFLPLKLIHEILEPAPSAAVRADADAALRRHLGELEPAIRAGASDAQARRGHDPAARTTAEVLATLAISDGELAGLVEAGLATPDADGVYRGADLELLEVIDETRARGLGDLFPMAILGPYAGAVRALVRTELDLFRARVLAGSALPPRPLDEIARDATRLGERLVVAMRAKLVIDELRAVARPTSPPAPAPVRPPSPRSHR